MGVVYDKSIHFFNINKFIVFTFFIVFAFIFTGYNVNAEGITLYKNGNQLESCSDCNTLVLPRTEYITDVRIDYGSNINFTSGSSVKGIANISFNGPPLVPLDSMNSCTFYIDINPFSATLSRNYYTQEGTRDYESGFHMESGLLPVNGSSFTSYAYFLCNITNDSVGKAVNFVGVQFAMTTEGGDIPSSISNAANSINQNNDINSNNILNGISQGNQNLEDINSDIDDIKDMFEESNEIGGEISDKMDTNNTLLGTISSKIQSFKDSVDGFLGGISEKIGEFIFGSKVCTSELVNNEDIVTPYSYLTSNGSIASIQSLGVTDYIETNQNYIEVLETANLSSYLCYYDKNKDLISCKINNSLTTGRLSLPNGTRFLRFSIQISSGRPSFQVNVCKNGNQTIFGKIRDFFDDLLNPNLEYGSDGTGIGGELEQIQQIPDTPISDLLLMPVNLINALYNALDTTNTRSSACTGYTIPFDFTGGNNTLTFPCFDGERFFGSSVWGAIDILFYGFMVYNIGMMIVSFYESWSSLQDTFDSLYVPRHEYKGYQPKHGNSS